MSTLGRDRDDGTLSVPAPLASREDLIEMALRRRAATADGDLRYYWKILYGRRWLILAATLAGLVVAAAMTVRQPRLYQAEATVEFKQPLPPGKDLRLVNAEVAIPPALAVRLLTTKVLAARVITAERAAGTGWDEPPPGDPAPATGLAGVWAALRGLPAAALERVRLTLGAAPVPADDAAGGAPPADDWASVGLDAIGRYYSHITIRPVPMTSLADIVVTHPDPRVAAQVANAHAQAFIDMDVASRAASLSDAQSLFALQLREVKENLESSRHALSDYQRAHGILSLPKDNTTITRESLQQLNALLTQAQGERIMAEANYRNAASMSADDLATALPDPSLQELRQELLALKARYGADSRDYGRNHPDMVSARARIEAMEARLREAGSLARNHLAAILEVAQAKERELHANFEALSKTASEEDRQLVQLLILQREMESNQQLFTSLLQQAKETDLESGAFRWTGVKLVDRAAVPLSPAYPATNRNLALGLLLGLLAGVGGCILIERLDNRIHTPDDIVEVLRLPAFGVIPDFRRLAASPGYGRTVAQIEEGPRHGRDVVTVLDPSSVVSEAYRSIRTNLLFASPGRPPKTVLVTSSQAGEGKTVTTINLAVSLALSGSRVLIVDADFRRPGCHAPMQVALEPGLSNVLTGQCELSSAVVQSPVFPNGHGASGGAGLFVLPAGTVPPNPAELLASGEMSALLEVIEGQFEFVIIDSPPVLPVTDSVVIATKADGVLMVVKGGEWGRDVVQQALSQLEAVRANVLGVLLNCVDVTRRGPAYYYYRHHYGAYYGEPPAAGARDT